MEENVGSFHLFFICLSPLPSPCYTYENVRQVFFNYLNYITKMLSLKMMAQSTPFHRASFQISFMVNNTRVSWSKRIPFSKKKLYFLIFVLCWNKKKDFGKSEGRWGERQIHRWDLGNQFKLLMSLIWIKNLPHKFSTSYGSGSWSYYPLKSGSIFYILTNCDHIH